MYVPTVFQQADLPTLHDFIDRHGFAVLCSVDEQGLPSANHMPLLLDRHAAPSGVLTGHMARANPQWRHADGSTVLAIFSGPHHYISPAWYQAESVVPTWNYVAVHVTGRFRAVHDADELLRILRDTVTFTEQQRPQPWQINLS